MLKVYGNVNNLFFNIFNKPYVHEQWIADQRTLIKRLEDTNDKNEVIISQIKVLKEFDKIDCCSPIMVEIIKEKIDKNIA